MLEPDDRRLLLEALRPPESFQLDYALATTVSLALTWILLGVMTRLLRNERIVFGR